MRGQFVCGVAILIIIPTIVWAALDGIPTLDVRPVCRGIASQSADPGVGQKEPNRSFSTMHRKRAGRPRAIETTMVGFFGGG